MLQSFKTPKEFVMHVGKDILLNGVDIYDKIEDCTTQYDEGHYELFGEDLGAALADILIGQADQEEELQLNKGEIAQIVKGILLGAVRA